MDDPDRRQGTSAPATPTVVTATFDARSTSRRHADIDHEHGHHDVRRRPIPTPANNTASVDLTISADVADLNITTAVDDSKPNQGDSIGIYIQVANAGPADATNIVLKDVLPTGLKYVSCEPIAVRAVRPSPAVVAALLDAVGPCRQRGHDPPPRDRAGQLGHAAEHRLDRVGGPSRPDRRERLRLAVASPSAERATTRVVAAQEAREAPAGRPEARAARRRSPASRPAS